MSDLRPAVASEQVLALLDQHFGAPISDLVSVEGGQVAHTFAFRANAQEYIIRFNHDTMLDSNLPKEAYLMRIYAERLLCYECHHALGALRFFAKSGHEESYRLTRALILHKLDAFAG
jgi:hypothetical protein